MRKAKGMPNIEVRFGEWITAAGQGDPTREIELW